MTRHWERGSLATEEDSKAKRPKATVRGAEQELGKEREGDRENERDRICLTEAGG